MDSEQAIAIIETVLAPKPLSLVQIEIVRGVIAGDSYQEIVAIAKAEPEVDRADVKRMGGYQISYIKETGAQLWQTLSQRLGKKVTKKSLAAVLLWYTKQLEFGQSTDRTNRKSPQIATDWGAGIQQLSANLEIDDPPRETRPVGATEPLTTQFYGRTEELATLTNWCLDQHCRLICLLGMGGMGKTRIAWEIAHQLEGKFDRTIWRSLLNAPPITELCKDLLQFFNPQPLLNLPSNVEGQIDLLIACLKRDRCLLVLDNVESILVGQVQCGQYLPGYDNYDRLFRAIGELPHQSCAILTSREKPHTITRLQIVNPNLVQLMTIEGLTPAAAYQLVQTYDCPPLSATMWLEIHAHYSGNPLALKIAAIAAVEMTGGGEKMLELYPLMKQGRLHFQNIDDILQRQFDRLSALEQQLVYWMAIEREPITGSALRSNLLLNTTMPGEIINALQSLSRRCITTCQARNWSIQPVITTYVTTRLIDRFVAELSPQSLANIPTIDLQHRFSHLNTYAIIKAQTKDYLRHRQIQLILHPMLERLIGDRSPGHGCAAGELPKIWDNRVDLSQHLRQILTAWQSLDPIPPGYLAGNILNFLIELEPDRSLP